MNTLKTFLIIGSVGIFTACGVTKSNADTSNNTVEAQTSNRGRSNTEVSVDREASRKKRELTNERSSSIATAVEAEKAHETKMQKMYIDLNMTPEQVNQFDRKWKITMDNWNNNNRNKTLNSFERTELQDNVLRKILSDTQFKKYRVWARDNAGSRVD